MANFQLKTDTVETMTVLFADPTRPGNSITVISSDPARLETVVGRDSSGRTAIVLTPLTDEEVAGLSVTVCGADGTPVFTRNVDLVADRALTANMPANPPVDFDAVNTYTAPRVGARPIPGMNREREEVVNRERLAQNQERVAPLTADEEVRRVALQEKTDRSPAETADLDALNLRAGLAA